MKKTEEKSGYKHEEPALNLVKSLFDFPTVNLDVGPEIIGKIDLKTFQRAVDEALTGKYGDTLELLFYLRDCAKHYCIGICNLNATRKGLAYSVAESDIFFDNITRCIRIEERNRGLEPSTLYRPA